MLFNIAIDVDGVLVEIAEKYFKHKKLSITPEDVDEYKITDVLKKHGYDQEFLDTFWDDFENDETFYDDLVLSENGELIKRDLINFHKVSRNQLFVTFYTKTPVKHRTSKRKFLEKYMELDKYPCMIKFCDMDDQKDYSRYHLIIEDNPNEIKNYGHRFVLVQQPYNWRYASRCKSVIKDGVHYR
jgi:predicted NAD-dependent protein-ADP-ribosyltransferase YbiA (DUF1768 family)